jgi:hypothetical protein
MLWIGLRHCCNTCIFNKLCPFKTDPCLAASSPLFDPQQEPAFACCLVAVIQLVGFETILSELDSLISSSYLDS